MHLHEAAVQWTETNMLLTQTHFPILNAKKYEKNRNKIFRSDTRWTTFKWNCFNIKFRAYYNNGEMCYNSFDLIRLLKALNSDLFSHECVPDRSQCDTCTLFLRRNNLSIIYIIICRVYAVRCISIYQKMATAYISSHETMLFTANLICKMWIAQPKTISGLFCDRITKITI